MTRIVSERMSRACKLTLTLHALCEFLTDPRCQSCQVLEICLKRMRDDSSDQRSELPRELLRSLRHVVPFAASHRRCAGQRCLPAEILMTYLTRSYTSQNPREPHLPL